MQHPSGDPSRPQSDQQDAARLLPTHPGVVDAPELPEGYGRPCLTLMVKDPHSLFAYWELKPGESFPSYGGPLWLSVYEIDEAQDHERSLAARHPVPPIGRYHLQVPHGGRSYVAQLENDVGQALLQSNVVSTPPGKPSDEAGAFWMGLGAFSHWFRSEPGGPSSPGLEKSTATRWLTAGTGSSPHHRATPPPLLHRLKTRVVITGKTSPNVRVIAQGGNVEVGPDGAFTIQADLEGDNALFAIRLEEEEGEGRWESSLIVLERHPWKEASP